MPQPQRFTFTLDADGDGAVGGSETYVIDGVKADFAAQLAAVASQINGVSGLAARWSTTAFRSPIVAVTARR